MFSSRKFSGLTFAVAGVLIVFPNLLRAQPAASDWAAQRTRQIDAALLANDIKGADRLLESSLDSARLLYGPASEAEAGLLEIAATVRLYQGDNAGRVAGTRRLLALRQAQHGERHRRTALAKILLATALDADQRSDSVEALVLDAFATLSALGLDRGPERLEGASALGGYYQRRGLYLKAETLQLEAMELEAALHGDTTFNYSIGCNNLGSLYGAMERFEESVRWYERCLALTEKWVGREHPDYALSLKNLGNAYRRWIKPDKAEPLTMEALAIARRTLPAGHAQLTLYLWAVADVQEMLGQYDRMLPFLLEAHENTAANFGPLHRRTITSLNKLGIYYQSQTRFPEAESYYRAAIKAFEASKQTEDEDYAQYHVNLGVVLRLRGRLDESVAMLQRAQTLAVGLLGPSSPRLFWAFNRHLVRSYLAVGRFEPAWDLTEPFRPIIAATYGEESRRMAEWEVTAGRVCQARRNTGEAIDHFERAFSMLRQEAHATFAFLSFSAKEAYQLSLDGLYKEIVRLGHDIPGNPRASGFLYDVLLFRKELLVDSESRLLRRWRQTADPVLRDRLLEYYGLRQQIILIGSRPPALQKELPELQARAESVEKELAGRLAAELEAESPAATSWRTVQQALRPGEAALEFVQLRATMTHRARYAALLLLPGRAAPELTLLGDVDSVDRLLSGAGTRPLTYAEQLYGQGAAGRELFAALWQPLTTALAGVRRVYLAPVGALHQLNFRALPAGPGGRTLGDRHEIVALTSTRRLADPAFAAPSAPAGGPALLFGGLDYETPLAAGAPVAAPPGAVAERTDAGDDRGGARRWTYLPETRREVETIDSLLRRHALPVRLVTGAAGTEALLKTACRSEPSPSIVHLATHGFFYAEPKKPQSDDYTAQPGFLYSENPMLRSGLILAGANPAWSATTRPTTADDGILTAEEVTLLHLDQTALVVLSACETGLGEARDYEGLYGLQRAFRVAGARAMIMTLWRVPDQPTRELMVDFYERLTKGEAVRAAFDQAVKALRAKYGAAYYWAGFVLVEG
jgi:CHAT domain-containing protein/tetratricopeptide (TPR) repeat protein